MSFNFVDEAPRGRLLSDLSGLEQRTALHALNFHQIMANFWSNDNHYERRVRAAGYELIAFSFLQDMATRIRSVPARDEVSEVLFGRTAWDVRILNQAYEGAAEERLGLQVFPGVEASVYDLATNANASSFKRVEIVGSRSLADDKIRWELTQEIVKPLWNDPELLHELFGEKASELIRNHSALSSDKDAMKDDIATEALVYFAVLAHLTDSTFYSRHWREPDLGGRAQGLIGVIYDHQQALGVEQGTGFSEAIQAEWDVWRSAPLPKHMDVGIEGVELKVDFVLA